MHTRECVADVSYQQHVTDYGIGICNGRSIVTVQIHLMREAVEIELTTPTIVSLSIIVAGGVRMAALCT